MKRRSFLGILSAFVTSSGCLGYQSLSAGDLSVENRMNSSVTVTVTVRKQSDDPDAEAPPLDAPAPEEDPLWRRDREYTVMGGGEATDDRFVTETGLFYVEAGIENGSSGSLWLNYGPSRDGAIAGPAISVDVSPDGSVLMDPVFDD